MQIQPYLFFNGRAEEAIDFYRTSLGAEVGMLMRFKESPEPGMVTPGTEEKVMHAALGSATAPCSYRMAAARAARASRASP
jgi:uncharacterized glyoxalase superfamily protein PhnB